MFKHTNNCSSVFFFFQIVWNIIYKTKLPTHISFLFSIFYLLYLLSLCILYHFNYSFNAQYLPFICDSSHVITLRGDGRILKIVYFLENCIGNDAWQCRYIRGICSYVCRSKQGRKTRALLGISWYH